MVDLLRLKGGSFNLSVFRWVKLRFFIEDGQGEITTENDEVTRDCIKEYQPIPIEHDFEDENLEDRISLVTEK